jgi:hypothetical protein
MLSRDEIELLTASVDGELTSRQRRLVDQLLLDNPEARTMLAKLQRDSHDLRSLPQVNLPRDLSGAILDKIAASGKMHKPRKRVTEPAGPRLHRPAAPKQTPRLSGPRVPWGYAAAAMVLVAIGVTSFALHFLEHQPTNSPSGIVKRPSVKPPLEKDLPVGENELAKSQPKTSIAPNPTPPTTLEEDEPDPMPIQPKKVLPELESEPEPPVVIGAPGSESPGKLEKVELALPALLNLHKLDEAEQSKRLLSELGSGNAFRVEILCRDATRGCERLRNVLHDRKWTIHTEPIAQARLKKHLWRTDYAVFLENLTPGEAVAILKTIGTVDRQAGEKKITEYRFDGGLLLTKTSRYDCREMADLLGLDPISNRPSPPMNKAVDIRRPLSEQTADHVAAALEGKGIPRPGTTLSNNGYLVALNAPRSRSAELKKFLEARYPPVANTVQLYIVLRNVGG